VPSFVPSFVCAFTAAHSLTPSLNHSLTHSLTHSANELSNQNPKSKIQSPKSKIQSPNKIQHRTPNTERTPTTKAKQTNKPTNHLTKSRQMNSQFLKFWNFTQCLTAEWFPHFPLHRQQQRIWRIGELEEAAKLHSCKVSCPGCAQTLRR